jgi:hypothetical protein
MKIEDEMFFFEQIFHDSQNLFQLLNEQSQKQGLKIETTGRTISQLIETNSSINRKIHVLIKRVIKMEKRLQKN